MGSKPSMWARIEPSLLRSLTAVYNFFHSLLKPKPLNPAPGPGDLPEVGQILDHAQTHPSDISDHMLSMFYEAMEIKPRLIVELGTRSGHSTFVLERVAALCGSGLVSVDLNDCSLASKYAGWRFVRSDDISFAQKFPDWCRQQGLTPEIDLLFIDTSHEYDHTQAEIRAWFPFLSPRAKVMFHDTNLRKLFFRRDGSLNNGWDNRRGVIRAIEGLLGRKVDERRDQIFIHAGWNVRHWAVSNGLTVLSRLLR